MKRFKCSRCRQVLGVPEKKFGKKIHCPNCNERLIVPTFQELSGQKEAESVDDTETIVVGESQLAESEVATVTENVTVPEPNYARIRTAFDLPNPTTPTTDPVEDSNTSDSLDVTQAEEKVTVKPKQKKKERKKKPVVARIIKSEDVHPEVDADGELPTLQLKEDKKQGPKLAEKRNNPIFIGLLLCGSLLVSGLILVFGDFQLKVDERALSQAREELTRFYTVRIDMPLKPYQIHLREAQLAHSRGDRNAEIENYRKVMAMFRAEDRNQYVGVTGSPTSDAELEHLVSIMLGDGRDIKPRGYYRNSK